MMKLYKCKSRQERLVAAEVSSWHLVKPHFVIMWKYKKEKLSLILNAYFLINLCGMLSSWYFSLYSMC